MCCRKICPSFCRPDHCRSCAVTEQNTGAPIRPIHHGRERLGSNYQNCLIKSCRNVGLCALVCKDKSRTGCLHIISRRVHRLDFFLDLTGHARKNYVRRRRCNKNQIDLFRRDPCIFQCSFCRLSRHKRCGLMLCNVAVSYTGPFANPLVICLNHLRQVIIAQNFRRDIRSRPAYFSYHMFSPNFYFELKIL